MEEERIFSGFCRAANGMRTILCEYDETGRLIGMDCVGEVCELKESCENYKKARSPEKE